MFRNGNLNVCVLSVLCQGTHTCCNSTWVAALDSQLLFWPICWNPAPGELSWIHLSNSYSDPYHLCSIVSVCFFISLCSMEQLNISWCDFSNNHVKSVVNNVSSRVTHLNLSGYRENFTLDGKKPFVSTGRNLPVLHSPMPWSCQYNHSVSYSYTLYSFTNWNWNTPKCFLVFFLPFDQHNMQSEGAKYILLWLKQSSLGCIISPPRVKTCRTNFHCCYSCHYSLLVFVSTSSVHLEQGSPTMDLLWAT